MSAPAPLRDLLGAWRSGSFNRLLLGSLVTVGALTAVAKVASLVKEAAVASAYGRGEDVDAFRVAYLAASAGVFLVSLAFNAALVPAVVEARARRGPAAAESLAAGAIAILAAFLLVGTLALVLLAEPVARVVGWGLDAGSVADAGRLLAWMAPVLALQGLALSWAGVLNAERRFLVTGIAPIATPLACLASLLLLAGSWGIAAYALGMVAGAGLELLVVLAGRAGTGGRVLPRRGDVGAEARALVARVPPLALGALLIVLTTFVDIAMASTLGAGAVAALGYGIVLVSGLLSVVGGAVGTAVLPHFAHLVAEGDGAGVRRSLRTWVLVLLGVTVPLSVGLAAFSRPLTELLFERGAFSGADTRVVASVQALYLLQLPGFVLHQLGRGVLAALGARRAILGLGVATLAMDVVFNLVFMRWLGVAGLALSTATFYTLAGAASVALVAARTRRLAPAAGASS